MTTDPIETLAQALHAARLHRALVSAKGHADALADDAAACAVQDRVAALLGEPPRAQARHWKSGGATPETQTHAPLPAAGVCTSPAALDAAKFNLLGVEAEIALRIGRDAGPGDVVDAVDAMCVAIEMVDSRWAEGVGVPNRLKLADFQLHGALVLGAWQPVRAVDWHAQVCRVRLGAETREFTGTHSFGDPFGVLERWARHLGRVRAGTVVTTGTWCGLLHARPGMAVEVTFPGIGDARAQF